MQLEEIKKLLLERPSSYIDFPFGDIYMVFKIQSKLFAIISLKDNPLRMNLKAEPNDAIAYREIYKSVLPGYHMNKKHWNTLILDKSIPKNVLEEMIQESYELVFKKLKRSEKEEVLSQNN